MNKMVKGSIAGATGIALLMGGVGTFALWSETVSVADTKISSGTLDLSAAGARTWKDISTDAVSSAFDPATDKIVPGDVVEMRQPLDVTAVGKNLKAELQLGGVPTSWLSTLDVDVVYAGKTLDVTTGQTTMAFGAADLAALNAATEVVVTFTFPTTVTGQVDQGRSLSITNATVALNQVR